ncbi:MAG: ATP-dependent DNA helicase RecG [Pseudomonadota bacterium]
MARAAQALHDVPVTALRGIGPAAAEKLAGLGIRSVQDILFQLPSRYQDRTRITPLAALHPGLHTQVEVEVAGNEVAFGRRRSLLVTTSDGSGGRLTLRFFHFSQTQKARLERGARLRCFGEARRGPRGLEMVHPEYQHVGDDDDTLDDRLTPVYPSTEGMHQATWRKLSDQALTLLDAGADVHDLLADVPTGDLDLPSLHEALRTLHRPAQDTDIAALLDGSHPARKRLAFEELLTHRLAMLNLRDRARSRGAPTLDAAGHVRAALIERLPFEPTRAQHRVIAEIVADIAEPHPMQRLVQGDVGSGKTVVAAAAAAQAIESGVQVALMAPTELLAEQHFHNFDAWFSPLGISVGWLSGKQSAPQRRASQSDIASGHTDIAVGTHALFQDDVRFDNLGLIVIDEQHRFGVAQRQALRDKGPHADAVPHQLIMTATPIPRTLAMTSCADLDYSVIDELPPGRTPVTTVAVSTKRRGDVVQRVAAALSEGRQAYWVCTLIEESESLAAEAAENTSIALADALEPHTVGLVHGRLKAVEKETRMQAFKQGVTGLLVATTVIEVGVDVPNASLMIIENPERLGLAQLHQLRGRVGRGSAESTCVLLYSPPLADTARERLQVLRDTNDGFEIAEKDLLLRGSGEIFGTRQTGDLAFRVADLGLDRALLPDVAQATTALRSAHRRRIPRLLARWLGEAADRYASV